MLPGIALCLSHQPMSHGSRIPVHCHQDVSPRWSVNQRQLFFFTRRQVVSGLEYLQILAFPPVHCQRYSLPSVIRCHNKCEEVTALSVSAPGGVRGGAYTHTSSLVVDGTGSPGYLGQRDITLSGFPTDWIPSLRPLGSALAYNRQMPPPPLANSYPFLSLDSLWIIQSCRCFIFEKSLVQVPQKQCSCCTTHVCLTLSPLVTLTKGEVY